MKWLTENRFSFWDALFIFACTILGNNLDLSFWFELLVFLVIAGIWRIVGDAYERKGKPHAPDQP